MFPSPIKLISVPALGFILVYVIRYHMNKKIDKRKLEFITRKNADYKAIFTTLSNFECQQHIYNNLLCCENCSNVYLQTIASELSAAKSSISMCMYHLALETIRSLVVLAHNRSVKVRIITDHEMTFATGSKIKYLEQNGIAVKRQPKSSGMMHHKFCLVDECDEQEAKVLFGSMNYTLQALCNNWDHLIITNNMDIIKRLSEEFEFLWSIF